MSPFGLISEKNGLKLTLNFPDMEVDELQPEEQAEVTEDIQSHIKPELLHFYVTFWLNQDFQ